MLRIVTVLKSCKVGEAAGSWGILDIPISLIIFFMFQNIETQEFGHFIVKVN